ncbi:MULTISPECIES: sensor histidine kinase [unclassified Gordonia (in: high G+C Gram-positive bacteria)]
MGIGYLVYGIMCLSLIVASVPTVATWWLAVAVPATVGTGVLLIPVGLRGTMRQIQITAAVAVISYLVAIALWWPARTGDYLDTKQAVWIAQFAGLPAIAAVIAFSTVAGFVALAVLIVGTNLIDHAAHAPGVTGSLIGHIAWGYAFSMVFVGTAGMGIRAARLFDDTRTETFEKAVLAAAVRARADERSRFDAFTHDSVMSTLLVAARRGSSPELADDARSALSTIATPASAVDDDRVDLAGLLDELHTAAGMDLTSDADVRSADLTFPRILVGALCGATAEAVRNSRRHGGTLVPVEISVEATAASLSVTIRDSGPGFDPDRVDPSRLGIALSIRDRMERAGGWATVSSSPGHGTTVMLGWHE